MKPFGPFDRDISNAWLGVRHGGCSFSCALCREKSEGKFLFVTRKEAALPLQSSEFIE